jgi:phosphoglucosamine mutase
MAKLELFGTDGIRGKANSRTMNTEIAVALGRAVAYYTRNSEELPQIVIGKDTRLSGYMLENGLASGITSMGLNVVMTGPLPTPGVSFICRSTRARMGIVLSASHNPADENGIKLFGQDGFKLDEDQEAEIEELMHNKIPEKNLAKPKLVGKITQVNDSGGRYVQYLKERFPHRLNLKGLKIAVDAANGAAYKVAPSVFSELGADVTTICNEPDGLNINNGCGALYPEKVCKLTKKIGANIGITLDGDADRVLISDENGNLVDGDAILYISAKHLHAKNSLGKSTVVGTVMTNYGLDSALNKENISLVRTDVGDHNVISYMRKNGINLGGESCGHLIYLHHSSTGDGILAALRILSVMLQAGKPLSELIKDFRPFPQETVNVHVNEKIPFDQVKEISKVKKMIDDELKGRGRTLLRYSGTEMVARITIESDDGKKTNKYVSQLADVVKKHLGN